MGGSVMRLKGKELIGSGSCRNFRNHSFASFVALGIVGNLMWGISIERSRDAWFVGAL